MVALVLDRLQLLECLDTISSLRVKWLEHAGVYRRRSKGAEL